MLPSKRIIIALALLIVFIVALAFYKYDRGSITNDTNAPSQNALTAEFASSTKSSAPQTNNNNYTASKNNVTPTAAENLTSTDTFARNLFAEVVKLNKSGVTVTPNNASQIASNYLKTAPLPKIVAKQYTASDLKIIDSSAANLKSYQSAITAVFTKYWPTGKDNEMLILQQTFSVDNPQALDNLSNTVAIYQKALDGCLALNVPQLATVDHLNVLNALSTYIQTLKMIQMAYTDPISGTVGLNAFTTNRAKLNVSMANLRINLINTLE
jgi:hypothetical protein